jgi:preprotein translocase subunit YajC
MQWFLWQQILFWLALIVFIALIWFLMKKKQEKPQAVAAEPLKPPDMIKPDDLKIIEGIGPKISDVLQKAGVTTFAHLAKAEVSHLEQILNDAGITGLANPATWPEQATLAEAGDMEALQKLQDSLKGGRRV